MSSPNYSRGSDKPSKFDLFTEENLEIGNELAKNANQVHDPKFLKKLLLQRISSLGENVKEMQRHNFGVEEDVLEKLSLLKEFN